MALTDDLMHPWQIFQYTFGDKPLKAVHKVSKPSSTLQSSRYRIVVTCSTKVFPTADYPVIYDNP